ncbi:MAG: hypothetical protein JSV54_03075 [Chloroflexota bacterium]|nr:MAG: hypothetical protein JSV54_03075 [Chloroflexota bacterium]
MEYLIYEDVPCPQQRRYILVGFTIVMIVMMLVFFFTIRTDPWLYIWLFSFILIYVHARIWPRRPRKYQIFDSRIRIVFFRILNRQSDFDIPFNNLKHASSGDSTDTRPTTSLNFITSYNKNIITLVRKKGGVVNITPNNSDLFLEKLKKALDDWRRSNPG